MTFLTPIIIIFSVLSGLDYILGNRFGIGEEFKKAFMLFGTMALSMIGMIVMAPAIGEAISPIFNFAYNLLHIDPSIIPASLFANDMGGAPLAKEIAKDESIGMFNALVVSSMMGCTVSFTIPFALGVVGKKNHRELLIGLLCGVVTIPIGCFVAGLICRIPIVSLLVDLLPLIIFSTVIAIGLIKFQNTCVKIFKIFGFLINALIIVGLLFGIIRFLTGKEIIKGLATIEDAAAVCLNASIVMSGMFPFINIVSRLLKRPLNFIGGKIGINGTSALGFISSLATSATTYGMMDKMDKKGVMLNSAFAVSAAFSLAGHLAFTMAFDASYIFPVIVGKLVSGASALALAVLIYKLTNERYNENHQ